jgi:ligand-binding SRPBCC domain-containing protein
MPIEHSLRSSMFVPLPRAEVFDFFADATNLEKITPGALRFEIVTPSPIHLQRDTLIEYRLGLYVARFKWLTRISEWDPPNFFVDEQLRGPYRQWIHLHSFSDENGGTRIDDHVRYVLPLSPLGDLAWPLVHLQLRAIFRFRERAIRRLLLGSA